MPRLLVLAGTDHTQSADATEHGIQQSVGVLLRCGISQAEAFVDELTLIDRVSVLSDR